MTDPTPLRLFTEDAEDLKIIAAAVQDAVDNGTSWALNPLLLVGLTRDKRSKRRLGPCGSHGSEALLAPSHNSLKRHL